MREPVRLPMRLVFGEHLVRLGAAHPELVVLDADVSSSTQTRLFGESYPDRFLNCGIAESNMVSVAAGMAAAGMRPVVSTFAFLLATRAADQVRSQIAYNCLPVVLAGGYAGLSDFADGASHQSIEDLPFFLAMPNLLVLCPGEAAEVEFALEAALRHDGPVYLRLSRAEVGRLPLPAPFEPGRALLRKSGNDIALISTGHTLETVLEAAEELDARGVRARVLDMHTAKPLDREALLAAARECGALVTVEEGSVAGGFGSAVASYLAQNCPVPLRVLGIRDMFGQSGPYDKLLEFYGLDKRSIVEACCSLLRQKGHATERMNHDSTEGGSARLQRIPGA